MSENKKYYKVVSFDDDNRPQSVCPTNWWLTKEFLQKLNLMYSTKEWTYPNVGKIFVFDNLSDAEEFTIKQASHNGRYNTAIYECEVENPQTDKSYYVSNVYEIIELSEGQSVHFSQPPHGTVFCDAVKLLEKVK